MTIVDNPLLLSGAYRASKTLAEKAAWNFVEENTINGVAPFDIATINPPLIFGPLLHQVSSPKALNTSVGAFYAYLTGAKEDKDANSPAGCYVDVRDVAQLHLEALVTPDAGNKRFAVNHGEFNRSYFIVSFLIYRILLIKIVLILGTRIFCLPTFVGYSSCT